MSLRFDTTDIKDREILYTGPNEKIWSEWVDIMAFATIPVGIGRITEKNYEEFYERYVMNMHAHGVHEWMLTQEIVKKFIGFHTNASSMTPAAFRKSCMDILIDKTKVVIRSQKREAERQASIPV